MKLKKWSVWVLLLLLLVLILNLGNLGRMLYPVRHAEYIWRYAEDYQVNPYLVMSIIKAESNFDEDAVSHKNASGLMQIIEPTAEWIADRMELQNFSYESITEPELNIQMGCYYISYLLEQYEGDLKNALAAYNAGTGNVNQWLANPEYTKDGKTLSHIPFPETRRYITRVTNNLRMYTLLYQ
ncbi:MAG: lytic transglycosylase domain-containing protein [Ruminococcaceae bacterium]|nr:lytic transglycosylase domain-containing protein [Oscillospiraceae bacterium]